MWACPIYGGERVVWCGPCLRPRVGVPSCAGVQWNWLCREEGKRWSLISSQHRQYVHSTGGDKQVLNVHTCTHGHIHIHNHIHTH